MKLLLSCLLLMETSRQSSHIWPFYDYKFVGRGDDCNLRAEVCPDTDCCATLSRPGIDYTFQQCFPKEQRFFMNPWDNNNKWIITCNPTIPNYHGKEQANTALMKVAGVLSVAAAGASLF